MNEMVGCDLVSDYPKPRHPANRGCCSECGRACWVPLSLLGLPLPPVCIRCIAGRMGREVEETGTSVSLWLPPSAARARYGERN